MINNSHGWAITIVNNKNKAMTINNGNGLELSIGICYTNNDYKNDNES